MNLYGTKQHTELLETAENSTKTEENRSSKQIPFPLINESSE